MREDGTNCRLRYIPVVNIGLGGMERGVGGPHADIVSVETTVLKATRGLLVSPCPPGWSQASE